MAERNANEQPRQLPAKIERRLAELAHLGDFDQGDVAHCRRTYWGARDDWHRILVDCHARAVERKTPACK
jgi:hypothetical protein